MENKQEDKIDLMKYLDRFYKAIQKKKWWMLLILIVCIGALEVKEYFYFNTTYSSSAIVVVSSSTSSNIYVEQDEDMISTFSSLIQGEMMQKVINEDLGTSYMPAGISIGSITDTNLLKITAVSNNASDAYKVIKSLIENYTQVTDQSMSDIHMTILEKPIKADSPDAYPNYIKAGIKGAIIGIVIDLVIALFYAMIRHTVLNSEDIKNVLGLETLTKIPYVPGIHTKHKLLLTNSSILSGFKQGFHDLRVSIETNTKKNPQDKTYLFTSTLPNEGKSITACNTALSLAGKGYSTVLVDLDLRNPSVQSVLEEKEVNGCILTYLTKEIELEGVITRYNEHLDVIFGSVGEEKANELLSSDRLETLIQKLSKIYDYVIIDVPPLYMMSDTYIISQLVSKAIVVVKQDYASGYDLLDHLEELNQKQGLILGCVLNQVKSSIFDHEQHSYGYGYGYGYGKKR